MKRFVSLSIFVCALLVACNKPQTATAGYEPVATAGDSGCDAADCADAGN